MTGGGNRMIESFSQCLQAWMKDTSRSIASVAADAHLKSKTTVARILKDQSTYQSYEKLYKALSSNTEIDEKWKSRFEHVLRAEKVGLGQYAMFETIRQKLLEPKACIRPVHPAEPITILIVGCPWQKTYEFIEQCLAQNQTVIYHYLTLNELLDNPPVLAGLMACLKDDRYQAFVVPNERLLATRISWNIMLQKKQNTGEERITISSGDDLSWQWLQSSGNVFREYQSMLTGLEPQSLYHNSDLKKGSDYIRMMKESWQMENMHNKVLLKPTPAIQMLPAEISIGSFTGFLDNNIVPVAPSADSIAYYFRNRAENFYNCETTMVISRQATEDFVHSGRLADHFFACRSFTREERIICLKYLLECMEKPQTRILFTKDEQLCETFSFEAFSKFGTLIYPSRTSYNAERDAYRELILPGDRFASLFTQFVDEMMIPEICYTEAESKRMMKELITMAKSE